MNKDHLVSALSKYLPDKTAPYVVEQLISHQVIFTISKPRRSKLGDYRPPFKGLGHRISVNGDLNPYHFLLTTLHELAHLDCWERHKSKVSPHGDEWKSAFQEQLFPVMKSQIFPDDVHLAINKYIGKPKSSSCYDPALVRTLQQYDDPDGMIFVSDIPVGNRFILPPDRIFVKGNKIRTRYKCISEKNNRPYLISSVARVHPL